MSAPSQSDRDVAAIKEAFLYVAPVHESVVRDAKTALGRLHLAAREKENLEEQLQSAQERLAAYEEPGWVNPVQKVLELQEQLEAALSALREVGNAYGCFAGCTGGLPGGGADKHTPSCAKAREVLTVTNSANPPITEERPRDAGTSGATT